MNTSRYSFLLLFLLALPIYICCPEILSIWLGTVPEYAVEFCRLMLLFLLIDAVQGPLWVSAQATGKIRNYQILMSVLILLNLPVTYVLLIFFKNPEIALIVRVAINFITAVARVIYLNHLYDFPIGRYMKDVILKCIMVMVTSYPIPYLVHKMIGTTLIDTFANVFIALFFATVVIALIGLRSKERILIISKMKQVFHLS